jgi:hypothetical protein
MESTSITVSNTAEMIGTEWPIAADHPEMVDLRKAFAIRLVGRIAAADVNLRNGLTIPRGEEINEKLASWLRSLSASQEPS